MWSLQEISKSYMKDRYYEKHFSSKVLKNVYIIPVSKGKVFLGHLLYKDKHLVFINSLIYTYVMTVYKQIEKTKIITINSKQLSFQITDVTLFCFICQLHQHKVGPV